MADSSSSAGSHTARNATIASNTTTNSRQSTHRSMLSFRTLFNRRNNSQFPETPRPHENEPPPPYSPVSPSVPDSITPPSVVDSAAPAVGPAATTDPAPGPPAELGSNRAASPAPSNRSVNSRLTADNLRVNEDPFAFLATFDTVFVIDDSGSMAGRPWREVHSVLAAIVPICTRRDADGVDIHFLNHRSTAEQQQMLGRTHQQGQPRVPPGKSSGGYLNVRSDEAVGRIFNTVRPGQSTPTGMRLGSILKPYLRFYQEKRGEMVQRGEYGDPDPEEVKPMNIIVITDGVPTDDLEPVLVDAAKKLDAMDAPPYQIGIQFFQVGTEPEAASYLKHLDDTLGQHEPSPIRDMIDTVTWTSSGGGQPLTLSADHILKTVLGAVVKRLDNVAATRGGRGGAGRAQRTNTNTLHP